MRHLILPFALLAAALCLGGCFSGGAQNPSYDYTAGPSQTKTYTLDWFTSSLQNNQSNGSGTVTISWNGTTVSANGFPTVLAIPQNAVVTVTASPRRYQFTSVQWDGVYPRDQSELSPPSICAATCRSGWTFISNATNG